MSLIASANDCSTMVFAGPVKPMWLSLICTNRRAFASSAAACVPASPIWLITSPPTTVSTTALPNHAVCRSNCLRVIPCSCCCSVTA